MPGHYEPLLVALSLSLSLLASWIAIDAAGRIHLQRDPHGKLLWLCLGSFAMGIGIWSMHYVGMLAYRFAVPVLYDWPTVLLSMLAAVSSSGIALYTVSRKTLSWSSTLLGGAFMGVGIAAMHYIGMAAMRMPCEMVYSWPLVGVSVIAAVGISIAGLRLTFGSRTINQAWSKKKATSALLMGFAIPTMHYLGMAAAHWTEGPGNYRPADLVHAIAITDLSTLAIVLVSVLVLLIAVVSVGVDRYVSGFQTALQRLRRNHAQLQKHHGRLQEAFRAGGVGIWECDPKSGLFYVDPSLRELYGVPQDGRPVPRDTWKACVHPDDVTELDRRWNQQLLQGDRYDNEYRIRDSKGATRRVRSIASIVRSEEGRVTRVLGMTWDVTAERSREQEASDLAARFRMTLEAIGDAVISTDEEHRIIFLNRAASQLTGWEKEESQGKLLGEVFVTRDEGSDMLRRDPVARCIESGGLLLAEDGILVSRSGRRYNIRKHVALLGKGSAAVITFQDITEPRRMEKELKHAATHDLLTGLANRFAFEKKLSGLWEENRYSNRVHCLCIVDLDRFKVINDTSGHLAGDALLQEIARLFQRCLRSTDLAARMGGDEFMVLLTDTTMEEAKECLRRLLESIRMFRFTWGNRFYGVTASLGLVSFDCFSPTPEVLVSQADVALYAAKRRGRNQVSVYNEEGSDAAGQHEEMEVVADLRRCLEEHCFELHAQPIVPAASPKETRYFEILVRMRRKDGRLIAPGVFIPAAERYGLITMVDRWVISTALASFRKFSAEELGVRFAINLSADSLSDPDLWAYVEEQLALFAVPASHLTFEVTETGLVSNLDHAQRFMRLAREAGSRIALDDFGTGLSSLSYLKQFPLDTIKVDGSFVRHLQSNPLDQAIVRSVTEIARSVHASTVAECVEDANTITMLRDLGVDYVQGWATGRPQPLEATLAAAAAEGRGKSVAHQDRPFLVRTDAA